MPRKCLLCTRPDRAGIDAELASGAACSGIARAIGVSADSVERHRNAHLPAAVLASRGAAEASSADRLLARVEQLEARMSAMLGRAEAAGDVKNAAAAAREIRSCLQLLANVAGLLRPEAEVNVNVEVTEAVLEASVPWQALRARILAMLGHYPEARQAVLAAIAGPSRGFDPDRG